MREHDVEAPSYVRDAVHVRVDDPESEYPALQESETGSPMGTLTEGEATPLERLYTMV